jgi:hypothetical protein
VHHRCVVTQAARRIMTSVSASVGAASANPLCRRSALFDADSPDLDRFSHDGCRFEAASMLRRTRRADERVQPDLGNCGSVRHSNGPLTVSGLACRVVWAHRVPSDPAVQRRGRVGPGWLPRSGNAWSDR